jgi:methionyl-tRNA formyltransferase
VAEGLPSPGEIISLAKDLFVVCGKSTHLRLEFVQIEGRKRISAREFANGARIASAQRFV